MTTEPRSTAAVGRVLVYGGNGVQGRAIAQELHDEGFEVVASIRDQEKASALTTRNIPIVCADLGSPETLLSASRGADAVVLTVPLQWSRELVSRWVQNAAEAARASGVGLMVLNLSSRTPRERTDQLSIELRREVEGLAHAYGPPTIVLRPPLFLENLEAPWTAGAMREGKIIYPIASAIRVAWLCVRDLGAYVGAALRRPELAGRAIDIGGPETLDGAELARELARGIGQPLEYVTVPPPMVEQQLGAVLGQDVAKEIARTYAWFAEHPNLDLFAGTRNELERHLGRPATTVYEWARQRTSLFRASAA